MGFFETAAKLSQETPTPPAPDPAPAQALSNDDDDQPKSGFFATAAKLASEQPQPSDGDLANHALLAAAQNGSDPDQTAKNMKTADTLGVGLPAVQENPADFAKQADVAQSQEILKNDPALASWLARTPQAAALTKPEDLSLMSKIGSVLTNIAQIPAAAWTGIESGYEQYKVGQYGVDAFTANNPALAWMGHGESADEALKRADALNTELGQMPKYSGPADAVEVTTNALIQQGMSALHGGLWGAILGGIAGAPARQSPQLARAGFAIGTEVDMAINMAGQQYVAMKNLKGLDGQPVSEPAAQLAAVLTGAGAMAVQRVLGPLSSKVFDFAGIQKAIASRMVTPTAMQIMGGIAQRQTAALAKTAGVMTLFEASSIATTEMAKSLSPGDWQHITPSEIADQLADAAWNGAKMAAVMHGSAEALSLYGTIHEGEKAQQYADALKDAMQGTANSKLRDRNALAFRSFLQSRTDGTPVENIYIPDHAVRALYQGDVQVGGDNDPFKFVPDMAEQLKNAEDVGGADIVINTADYINNLSGTKVENQLLPDIKLGANAMSLNDKVAHDKEYQEELKDAMAIAAGAEAGELNPEQRVYHDVYRQGLEVGLGPEIARVTAGVAAARYNARASVLNKGLEEGQKTDAWSEYQRSGMAFQKGSEPAPGALSQGGEFPGANPGESLHDHGMRTSRLFVPPDVMARAEQFVKDHPLPEESPVPKDQVEPLTKLATPIAEAAERNKPEFDRQVDELGAELGGKVSHGPLKKISRMIIKLHKDYRHKDGSVHPEELRDALRSTIILNSRSEIPAAIEALKAKFDVIPGRLKDRFTNPLPSGYSDVLVNVRMPDGTQAEIQLNVPEMSAAKSGIGHQLYDIERHDDTPAHVKEEAAALQRSVYDAAREAHSKRVGQDFNQNATDLSNSAGERSESGSPGRKSLGISSPLGRETANVPAPGTRTIGSPESALSKNLEPLGKSAAEGGTGSESGSNIGTSGNGSILPREPGESDKAYAKRVIDKQPVTPKLTLPSSAYFLPGGVSVPLENLHASKPPEDNADNAIKRMAAAAEGILSKRPPIDVRPRPLEPGHYDVVDGNGTLAAAKKAGLTDLPVNVVSPGALPTRIPSAKGMEQPLSNVLTTDLESATTPPEGASPKAVAGIASHFAKVVAALAREPGMEGASRFGTVGEKAEYIINRMKENLLALHDRMDREVRERAKLWYDGGRVISEKLSQKWGKTVEQTAAMLAALSPQKDWFMNNTMAERVGDILHTQQDHVWDKDMHGAAFSYVLNDELKPEDKRRVTAALDVARGKSLREVLATGNDTAVGVWIRAYDEAHHSNAFTIVSPEGNFNDFKKTAEGKEAGNAWQSFEAIGAAASIFMDGSRENISAQLGTNHKVRNFYNNILNPHDARFTTIDTHAVGAALNRPLSSSHKAVTDAFSGPGSDFSGMSGTYALYQEAYERAAAERGMLPREMQSITWEAVRGMFDNKSDNLTKAVDAIHAKVAAGEMTDAEGRQAIVDAAGGIKDPDWFKGHTVTDDFGNAEKRASPPAVNDQGSEVGHTVLRDSSYRPVKDPFSGTRMAFEVAPNPKGDPELYARWNALTDSQKADITHRVAWAIAAKAMATTFRTGAGKPKIAGGELHTQIGGHLEDTNPSMSIFLDNNVSGPMAETLTKLIGYALDQPSMATSAPPRFDKKGNRRAPPKGWEHKGAFEVDLGGPKSVAEIRAVYDQLRAADPRITGHTTDSNGHMAILVDKGLEKEIGDKAFETLGGKYNVHDVTDGLDVNWPKKGDDDYGFARNTEELQSGSPLREHADHLRSEAAAQLNAELDRAESASGRTAESPVGSRHTVESHDWTLNQPAEPGSGPRGQINLKDGSAIVRFFRSSDASTPIHEMGHLWLKELIEDAKRPEAPQQLKDDLATVLKWFGVDDPSQIEVRHHEQWARGVERYFMEGKAPSTALARIFSRLKGWMTKIYKTLDALKTPMTDEVRDVMGRLLATDEQLEAAQIRSGLKPVFESAEQAGMTKAEWNAYLKDIDNSRAKAEGTLLEKAMAVIRRSRTKEWKAQADQYRPEIEQQVDARPDVRAWSALKSKEGLGGEKVSRETVEVNYPELADKIPAGFLVKAPNGIHVDHAAELFGYGSGRELLEALANLKTQEDQAKAAGDAKQGIRQHLIDQGVREKMEAEHGDIMDPQSMQDEATAAVHSEQQHQLMATELYYLRRTAAAARVATGSARKAGKAATDQAKQAGKNAEMTERWKAAEADLSNKLDLAKKDNEAADKVAAIQAKLDEAKQKLADLKESARWDEAEKRAQAERLKTVMRITKVDLDQMRASASTILGGRKVGEASQPERYLRDERTAARDVQKALLAGDAAGAAKAKQRQLLSSILYTEAKRNQAAVESTESAMKATASKPTIKSWDQGILDQMHGWMQLWGFDPKRDPGELQRALMRDGVTDSSGKLDRQGTFDKFVQDQWNLGRGLPYETWMSRGGDLHALTMDQFKGISDLFKALRTAARDEQKITAEGKELALDEAVADLVATLKRLKQSLESEYATPDMKAFHQQKMENTLSYLKSMNASLTKKEQLFDWWDEGSEGKNPFEKYIMRPLRDALHRKNQMVDDLNKRLETIKAGLDKNWADNLRDVIADHDLTVNGKQMKIDRKAMIKIALNWGTQDNADKLTRGYGWDHSDVQSLLDKNMRPDDWKFVQGLWSMYDAYREPLDALQRRVSGIGIKFVEGRTVDTPAGPIEGKYFPLDYDWSRSRKAETLKQKNEGSAIYDDVNYYRPETSNGSVISRVSGVNMPVDLSLDNALRRLGQTVHDLAFREAIMQADKLLSNSKVADAIDASFGKEYQRTFRPWLKAIARSANNDEAQLDWLGKLSAVARANIVAVGIGFRLSTVFKHGLGALANSAFELGHYFARGVAECYVSGNPWAKDSVFRWALENSKELPYRLQQYDRDTQEKLLHAIGGVSTINQFKNILVHYSHMPVSWFDFGSAVPSFVGAYRRAVDQGMSHDDAVYAADKVVRQVHGSQSALDQVQYQQSNNEIAKATSMFYGYFSHVYNREQDTLRRAGKLPGQIAEGDISGASRNFMTVLMRTMGYLIVPGLSAAYVNGGPDHDKGEGWWGWAGKAIAAEVPAGLPIVRDIAKAAIEGRDYEPSPIVHLVNTLIETAHDSEHAFNRIAGIPDEKKVSTHWVQHLSDSVGYFTGLPTGQAGASAQFLWNYAHHEEDPRDISDWVRGLAKGTLKKPKGH